MSMSKTANFYYYRSLKMKVPFLSGHLLSFSVYNKDSFYSAIKVNALYVHT